MVGIGTVLEGKYALESIVPGGDKGMFGVVYKAKDLLLEEAEERNPYVAVKVLSDALKEHPDAFAGLAGEARKAQGLAHPNILTVYQFSRHRGNAFIVMELLEGESLGEVIRAHRDTGLPVAQALRIIDGLARGLGYAHSRRPAIIHSDVKPSNAFLTREGQVKLLDFGIAREADADNKRFEGALSAAYASPEQWAREPPHPADDIYALGVVSYELLTGHHPFEVKEPDKPGGVQRLSSERAMKLGLRPARVKGLSRSQWQTLRASLSFVRGERPQSGDDFAQRMRPRKLPVAALVSTGIAGLVIVGAVAVVLPAAMDKLRVNRIVEHLQSKDMVQARGGLDEFIQAPRSVQDLVRADNKDLLINLFVLQARAAFDPPNRRYDYARARAWLDKTNELLPDSSRVRSEIEAFETAQKQELNARTAEFERLLADRQLLSEGNQPSVISVREIVGRLDATHPILTDSRVPAELQRAARAAVVARDLDRASRLFEAWKQVAPTDPALQDFADQYARVNGEQTRAQRVAELEKELAPLAGPGVSLDAIRAQIARIEELRTAAPNSTVLTDVRRRAEELLRPLLKEALASKRDTASVLSQLGDLGPVVSNEFAASWRAQVASLADGEQVVARQVAQLRQSVQDRLAAPPRGDRVGANDVAAWTQALRADLQKLGALKEGDAEIQRTITAAEQQAAAFLLQEAAARVKANRLELAAAYAETAEKLGGAAPADLASLRKQITEQKAKIEESAAEANKQSALALDKRSVITQAGQASTLEAALQKYRQLAPQQAAGDPWVLAEAPKALADGFIRRAVAYGSAGNWDEARKTLAVIGTLPRLAEPKYNNLDRLFAGYAEAAQRMASVTRGADLAALADLSHRDVERWKDFQPMFADALQKRITALQATQPGAAEELRKAGEALFPGRRFVVVQPVAAPVPAPTGEPAQRPAVPPPAPAPQAPAPEEAQKPAAPAPGQPRATAVPEAGPAPRAQAARTDGRKEPYCSAGTPKGVLCSGLESDEAATSGIAPKMAVMQVRGRAVAIMTTEVSNQDYARYCAPLGCSVPATSKKPVTTASVHEAEAYAAWLSGRSSAHYRLPNDADWQVAAAGITDANQVNCSFGGIVKDTTYIKDVGTLRDQNEYRLRDILGNVREWVKVEGGYRARGGSVDESREDVCMKDPSVPHDGKPDGKTGFRLVREIP